MQIHNKVSTAAYLNIDKSIFQNETSLVVRAQTPFDLPVFGPFGSCDYQIIVSSV